MDVRCKMRWESPPLTEETIMAFKDACQKFGYGPEQVRLFSEPCIYFYLTSEET